MDEGTDMGEILFSLCYMPTSGRLTFVALKGRSITDQNVSGKRVILLNQKRKQIK